MSLKSLENYLSVALEGPDIIFEGRPYQRNPDGSFVQVNTGEIRGIVVAIHSSIQHETLFSPLLIWLSLKLKT